VIPMTLAEVAAVVDGEVHDDPDAVTVTGPAFFDTRTPEPGGLFAAFVGERADGHAYAVAAIESGAAAVLGSRPTGVPTVVVDDPQEALGRLATHLLERLPAIRVLAVTGSQGKTSTKDLLTTVLSDAAPTVATAGSFNNELGLPVTVLRSDESTRFLMLEMGARGIGHLRTLCAIARPDVSLVLNVGKAHLGEFGTQDDIATAKGELVEALTEEGTAVLNADDPRVAAMAARTSGQVVTFGTGADADVRLGDVTLDEDGRPHFTLTHRGESVDVALRLVGRHQAMNAAAAVAAATAVGIPLAAAGASLGRVETLSRWRMEVHTREDGVTVVNDAYNANPGSMEAALDALVALGGTTRRTVAVLGEMRELGESATAEHEGVGRLAVRLGVHRVVAVGEAARGVHAGALEAGANGEEAVLVEDNDTAVRWLEDHLRPGDVVLLKASRGAQLDRVADALLTQREETR
jgi:UDP-N-acetylmuramoyl-tripeptide--D-alanyl-D-alanine ligase